MLVVLHAAGRCLYGDGQLGSDVVCRPWHWQADECRRWRGCSAGGMELRVPQPPEGLRCSRRLLAVATIVEHFFGIDGHVRHGLESRQLLWTTPGGGPTYEEPLTLVAPFVERSLGALCASCEGRAAWAAGSKVGGARRLGQKCQGLAEEPATTHGGHELADLASVAATGDAMVALHLLHSLEHSEDRRFSCPNGHLCGHLSDLRRE
mmetsp:Transcript_72001/g.154049  ORF Transcript_72001/g.154049 Transcript_72001/m.154049 type:complete len:207 (-) Transcript_72001:2211-2831(-)